MSALKHEFFDSPRSSAPDSQPISIFIADDSLEIRTGLRELFKRTRKFQVVGEAADGFSAIWQATAVRPQVMVIRAGLRGADGAQVIETIKELLPDCKIVAMVSLDSDSEIYASIAAGADGCCIRKLSIDDLKTAIRSVAGGGVWYDPVVRRCLARACTSKSKLPEPESAAESSILQDAETSHEGILQFARYYRPRWYHQRRWVTALHWVLVVVFAALVMLSTGPLVRAVLDHLNSGNYQNNKNTGNSVSGPTAPIPGIAYTLFELQCRTWHRYRGTPSFNLASDSE